MSCSANAWGPDSRDSPLAFTSLAARSKIWVPAWSVRRNASSSAYATCAMRSQPLISSV